MSKRESFVGIFDSQSLDERLLSFMDIHPGDWVVIKPNLVKESKENDPEEWECVITSPNLLKYVAGYVATKVGRSGRITICDAPQTDSSFARIKERLGLEDFLVNLTKKTGAICEFLDLRDQEWKAENGVIVERKKLKGDPNGKVAFNLSANSLFFNHPGEGRYYGADYESEEVNRHHCGTIQEYLLAATPIKADVFINMPKLKTHKKTGVTLNIKNLVGINAEKNWLPHHVEGSPKQGGDQFPNETIIRKIERFAVKNFRRFALSNTGKRVGIVKFMRRVGENTFGSTSNVIRSGNWFGNDTTWRMAIDLNRCLLYGLPNGMLDDDRPRKRYYSVVDGIICMEGSGPMQGDRKECGIVLLGDDPVAVDMVACRAMGFDWRKLPIIYKALEPMRFPISDLDVSTLQVISNRSEWNGLFLEIERKDVFFDFEPHFGWKGHVEYGS